MQFTDPEIIAEYITYPSPKGHGQVRGYWVRPAKATGKLPAVVVVHENRGLNPYIEDVARRLAKAGFIALAPDGLTSVGGYPGNDDKGRELQQTVDPEKLMNDFFAAIEWLMKHDATRGKIGITGFCYGGGVANAAAVAYPELGAAVPFYGANQGQKSPDEGRIPPQLALCRGCLQYIHAHEVTCPHCDADVAAAEAVHQTDRARQQAIINTLTGLLGMPRNTLM
ncbi:dienelactone hydrolase family protein [Pseudomonas wuhanensis]|uniref:dienelactone hydrolase family protein n=1 Tax=Pseudomonas wuhanensis TaxID=2954098 RepID=UPI003D66EB18